MLEPEFIERMRKELLRMRAEILQQLKSDDESYREIIDDENPKDPVDAASDDIDRSNLDALSFAELQRLKMIEAALSRMENGLYGICADTGKPIPRARLEAIPYTILSVEAQTAREKAKKR
jgi:RNA polymerase-binding protein DksA